MAGAWVTKEILDREGVDEPWAPAIGAAVAAGTASIAPMLRRTLRAVLGVPDPLLGLAEDYLALQLGTEAVGLSMEQVKQIASGSVDEVKDMLKPAIEEVKGHLLPTG